jgi:CCR4-NOT transcription complex subunit 1
MVLYSCTFPCPFLSCRHTELCVGSLDDDFDSLLSEIGKEISMADIITELGYGCTADIAHCKDVLSLFEPLNDLGISKLLGAVVSTTLGLDEANNTYSMFISAFGNSQTSDSFQSTAWNINVLVDSINEIVSFCYLDLLFLFFVYDLTIFLSQMQAPRTNWISVMENLDHEGFSIRDEGAFRLLMSIYSQACKVYTVQAFN